jgi:hypothetical protein
MGLWTSNRLSGSVSGASDTGRWYPERGARAARRWVCGLTMISLHRDCSSPRFFLVDPMLLRDHLMSTHSVAISTSHHPHPR